MSRAADGVHRATILVGWGGFGREVLRRLLVTAALRDLLRWETDGEDALRGERRLAGLELLSLGDRVPAGGGAGGLDRLFDDTDLEVLRDVEAQIRDLGDCGDEAVAAEVVGAARRLLAAPPGAAAGVDRPPGLDVMVVAHLADREAMGRLDAVMGGVFHALGTVGTLQRGVAGASSVAAIAVLDVDNYWEPSPAAQNLRQALAEKVGRWEVERQQGRMTFGRVYMSGEMARHSVRPPRLRGDEISLFLELLLFEGRRRDRDDFQRLFQPLPAHEPSLGTFGIRLFERNHALLRQLAAARFATSWLRYLAGEVAADEERPSPSLSERLAAVHPQRLDALLGWDEVGAMVDAELRDLEEELAAIPAEREDWAAVVAACCERRAATWRRRLDDSAGRAADRMAAELAGFPEALDAAITASLCDGHRPLPLGVVLEELAALRAAAGVTPPAAAATEPGSGEAGRALEELSGRYRRAREERLGASQLRWLLTTLSVLAGSGAAPFVRQALEDLPAAGPMTHPGIVWLLRAAQAAAQPVAAGLLALLLAAAFFFLLVGPAIRQGLDRAERVYGDRRQGRMIDALRAALRHGVSDGFVGAAEQLRRDLAVNAAAAVDGELERAIRRLEELRREVLWLAEQLGRFLALYGLEAEGDGDDRELAGRDRTGIRQRAERASDVATLLRAHPPEPALYRHLQADGRVFAEWRHPFRSPFLRPLEFLLALGQRFHDDGDAAPDREHDELLAFLGQRGGPALAFDWREREGVPAPEKLALLSTRWAALAGVRSRLLETQVDSGRTFESEESGRAYLLSVRLGLRPALLKESA